MFIRPPSDICLQKLKRYIYGLDKAPCSWYKRVNHELTNLKGIVNTYDNALFLWYDATDNLTGILAMYIEDFLFCGNDLFQKNVIAKLKKKKYSKLEHMKVENFNFSDWVLSE